MKAVMSHQKTFVVKGQSNGHGIGEIEIKSFEVSIILLVDVLSGT